MYAVRPAKENGFTLTEVLIGTAVLGLALATFLVSIKHAIKLVERADLELQALRRAENLLVLGGTFRDGAKLVLVPSEEELPDGLIGRVQDDLEHLGGRNLATIGFEGN